MSSRGAHQSRATSGVPATLGGRLRQIRKAWGWTQGQLADRLNTDQQIISAWERDKAQPSRSGIALLAEFFGLSTEALVTGKGFTVPDLPPNPNDHAHPILRHLPQGVSGKVVTIPLGEGATQALSVTEAKRLLDQLSRKGARLWLVIAEDE